MKGPAYGSRQIPTEACPTCDDRFFTRVGLDEHVRVGDHSRLTVRTITPQRQPEKADRRLTSAATSPTPTRKPYRLSEAGLRALRASGAKTGKAIAALNNSQRRRCDGCSMVTTPAALGAHQKHTGHSGWSAA